MQLIKRLALVLLVVFLAIQFIRPVRNINPAVLSTDITKLVSVPEKVSAILKHSCYDCHSNNTRYPWYMNIQPMGWVMADHIKDGKKDLNFSEFGSYSLRKQTNKLSAIEDVLQENEMPLSSYLILHRSAKLSDADKQLIVAWVAAAKETIDKKD